MNENKEHVFGRGIVTALTVALGTGIGLIYGWAGAHLKNWEFLVLACLLILLELGLGLVYEAFWPLLKRKL